MASSEEKKNIGGKTTTKKSTVPIKRDLKSTVPGLLAWGVGMTAAAPLERLKVLLQVQNSSIINYMGTNQGLKYIWRTEGFRGLFKGNGTHCAHRFTYSAVKFLSYDQASRGILWLYRQQSGNEDAKLTPLLRFGAGACAAIIATSVTNPIDMVRGRITVQTEKSPYQYRGMFHALSTVLREEGPRALYKGCLPSAFGTLVYIGFNFAAYGPLKDRLTEAATYRLTEAVVLEFSQDSKLRAEQIASAKEGKLTTRQFELVKDAKLRLERRLSCWAAFAAVITHTVAYPFDVIHRRMQMVGWKNASSIVTGDGRSKETLEYTGMVDAFRKTVRNEGFKALYKGWVPNLVKVGSSVVLTIATRRVLKEVHGIEVNIKTDVFGTP